MIVYERPVRFEDVDAAGIVFFGRFMNYAHEAMEHFFGGVAGGYVDLITRRKIGFPAVHVTCDFRSPLRYGDVVRIAVSVAKIGNTSSTLRYEFTRADNGASVALMEHVTVASDLVSLQKLALPDDVRAHLELHRH
ncbi:4-hydroxybenzoyl-CoA thioesterase family active site protein [Labilithrix luteola]|uniref:4-hydroxybenzoyl-CoA thioesterase family active site protein n=1 Tax=Labilithrix luteola TaxID=1391654 RepID=A0A0K1Q7R0_9BACT|nr:acyl-CoA thioesterase [Labilithrix luteola]AKV01749.1 4-hydroxybenzoyl-CoA thioesterase family active site protein [Labilithrix luteola]